jgi:hypothetical protein
MSFILPVFYKEVNINTKAEKTAQLVTSFKPENIISSSRQNNYWEEDNLEKQEFDDSDSDDSDSDDSDFDLDAPAAFQADNSEYTDYYDSDEYDSWEDYYKARVKAAEVS